MRIEALRLRNYCQHKDLSVELGPGIIGIVGPNGSGKSNLINAIKRLFTGRTDNDGKNEEDLTWGAEKGSLDMDFWAGQKGHIHRDIKTARCLMTYGNDKFTTATEIDDNIYNILGVTPKVLSDMVFIKQGEVHSLLFKLPSERSRSFQIMFGTEAAEKIRDILHDESTNLAIVDRTGDITKLKDALPAEFDKPIADLKAQLVELNKKLLPPDDFTKLRELVARHGQREVYQAQFTRVNGEVSIMQERILKTKERLQDMIDITTETSGSLENLKTEAEAAQARITAYVANANKVANMKAYVKAIEAAQAVLSTPQPAVYVTQEAMDRASKDCSSIRVQHDISYNVVNRAATQKTCPTCFQPINESHIAEHKEKLPKLAEELKKAQEHVNLLNATFATDQLKVAVWKSQATNAHEQIRVYGIELTKIGDVQEISEAQLQDDQEFIKSYSALAADQRNAINMKVSHEQEIKSWETALQRGIAEATRLQEAMKTCPTDEQATEAKVRVDAHTKVSAPAGVIAGQVLQLEKMRVNQLELLKKYEAEQEANKKKVVWRDMLESAKIVLHRDQLPNLVAQAYAKDLNIRLAHFLEIFNVPFTAQILPDLSIECTFSNRMVSANRLSGGQKVALGVAFHLAKNDMFASSLGLLVLDEPTVFLDEDSIDCMVDILAKVKSYSMSAGLQVIVVTHETELFSCFDKVIKL